ncbi:hypothetical protein V6N13_071887 [Hibiscus sabdariffa]|uniref:VQ domain-containing protein n=1 Tax=Hibiscus sabdariffa TaxID=183260 RepID=A0ABR2TC76_9ROSI
MGKKISSQAKSKTSCTQNQNKPYLNSLVKVLRPKVYIIDSPGFKTLVQELTGNATVSSPSTSSSSSLSPISEDSVPVIEVGDDPGNPENSTESSFDASVELPLDDTNSSEDGFMNDQRENSSVFGDLQAFLQLDHVDEQCFGSFNNVYSEIQQEVSIYDYELSGLV